MEGSTVRPLGPKSNGVRVFTQPEAVRAYLQQRKIIVHDSSSPFAEDDPSLPQQGKIRKSRKLRTSTTRPKISPKKSPKRSLHLNPKHYTMSPEPF